MASNLSFIADAQGWKHVGSLAVGSYEGYPFAVKPETEDVKKADIVFALDEALPREHRKAIQKTMHKSDAIASATEGATITCYRKDEIADGSDLKHAIETAVNGFKAAGIAPPVACPFCKRTDSNAFAYWDGVYTPVHSECVAGASIAKAEKAGDNDANGNILTGIIGAFLGGLIGIIPSVLSIVFADRVVSILYALIPICCYFWNNLFRGKMNKAALAVTIVMSIVHLFTLEQVLLYAYVVREYDEWPSIFETVSFYWANMSFSDVVSDMAMSFLFLGLGIWIAWGYISRSNVSVVNDLMVTKDSLHVFGE